MTRIPDTSAVDALSSPIVLPCGRRVPNRLVKAALEELLSLDRLPDARFNRLYRAWSEGGFGMILSGNVQVSPKHLGLPFDVAVPEELVDGSPYGSARRAAAAARFTAWASAMATDDRDTQPVRILQLNHPGRQSMRVGTGRALSFSSSDVPTLAPSAVRMTAGTGSVADLIARVVWEKPKAMDARDVDAVVEQFRTGARWARETGWDGVELHASHGYLLSQFLSPHTNRRTDEFGGTARKRLELLLRIADAIRLDHPLESGFVLGVKLNASDYIVRLGSFVDFDPSQLIASLFENGQKGGLSEDDALDNVRWISEHGGFDFIEISGGSYEAPQFLSTKASTLKREAFFAEFASRARGMLQELEEASRLPGPKPLILLTGGFRTRRGMHRALDDTATDLVGIGRPAAVDPGFARKLVDPTVPDEDATMPTYDPGAGGTILGTIFGWLTLVGPSLDVFYHTMHMHSVAFGRCERAGTSPVGDDDSHTVRPARLVPFSTLARRTYVDRAISPRAQLVALCVTVGLLSWCCLSLAGLSRR
ncbi:hypothetical protein JCM11491_007100 [Sporobolomyces phaffii]